MFHNMVHTRVETKKFLGLGTEIGRPGGLINTSYLGWAVFLTFFIKEMIFSETFIALGQGS